MDTLSALSAMLGGEQTRGLQNVWDNFQTSFGTNREREQSLLNDRLMANSAGAGMVGTPSGQDVIARALSQNASTSNANFDQQALGFGQNLMTLIAGIQQQEQQRTLQRQLQAEQEAAQREYLGIQQGFQGNQSELQRQFMGQQQRLQQVENPLAYQEGMIPINTRSFNEATEAYRRLYPHWNDDPNAGLQRILSNLQGGTSGGGGGGGMGGGTSDPNGLPEWNGGGPGGMGNQSGRPKEGSRSWLDQFNQGTRAPGGPSVLDEAKGYANAGDVMGDYNNGFSWWK